MKRNYFLLGLGIVPLILGHFGNYNWVADIFSHFRIYYLLYFFLLIILGFFRKNKILTVSSSLISVILLLSISSFYLPKNDFSEQKDSLKIVAINLWSSNRDFQAVKDYLNYGDFDVIIFQELTPRWDEQLRYLKNKYPAIKRAPKEGNFGIALYSRKPLQNIEIQRFSKFKIPTVVSKLNWKGKTITIIGTHPVPPVNSFHFKQRNAQFKSLNLLAKEAEKNSSVVIIGDFNCTNFSPNFDLLTDGTTLKDSRKGLGLQNSWNTDISFIRVAIDHALVSKNLKVVDRKLGPYIGSDHFPLELEIAN